MPGKVVGQKFHLGLGTDDKLHVYDELGIEQVGEVVIYEANVEGDEKVGGDSEHTANGKGPIVRSPDGSRWRLKVANDGTVSAESV